MPEFVYTGADDGRKDSPDVKIENEAEAWAHQFAWDAELTGRAPMGVEPEPKHHILDMTVGQVISRITSRIPRRR